MDEVRAVDQTLLTCVDLIPPESFGFPKEVNDLLQKEKHEFVDSRLGEKHSRVGKHAKHKLFCLNVSNCRKISQIWEILATYEPPEEDAVMKEAENPEQARKSKSNRRSAPKSRQQSASPSFSAATSAKAHLIRKLEAKLNELRGNRKAQSSTQYKEKVRLKRKLSKMKSKQRKKLLAKSSDARVTENHDKTSPKSAKPAPTEMRLQKPSDGGVLYNKFEVSKSYLPSAKKGKKKKAKKNKLTAALTGKDYKRLLEKVNQREEKLAELREKDPDKAKRVQNKIRWSAAIQRAEGVKVKDDKKLLQKALYKKQKRKERSAKQWAERERKMQQRMEIKQKKRKENIVKRIQQVKDKKQSKR